MTPSEEVTSARRDAMFAGAGKKAGLLIWRIEQFDAKPLPKDQYGRFYKGDCYLVLSSTPKHSGGTGLTHELYYWLGSDCSQDEQGAAAMMAVELDNRTLGGAAVQLREVHPHESAEFKGLFRRVEFLKGGVASGFAHVDPNAPAPTRLFQVKGTHHVSVTEVDVGAGSLNSGDVFLLSTPGFIYQWNGAQSNLKERSRGLDIAAQLRDSEHGGKAKVTPIDEGAEGGEFWSALGGKGSISKAVPDDSLADKGRAPKLFKCSDSTGALKTTAVPTHGPLLTTELLSSADVFIIDCRSELYVWVGAQCSAEEKQGGMQAAATFLKQGGRPAWTRVRRVVEGAEPPLFRAKFADAYAFDARASTGGGTARSGSGGGIAQSPRASSPLDLAASMLNSLSSPFKPKPIDDGSGEATVFRIKNFEKTPVPPEEFGVLYEGDSYIVRYVYNAGPKAGGEQTLIYFWQGAQSSQDERGASAILASEEDASLGGKATQVRLEQGKETEHFLRIFHRRLVVRKGGHRSGFTSARGEEAAPSPKPAGAGGGTELFQVKGYSKESTYAVQVDALAASLNSGDSFVLLRPDAVLVWHGEGASADERAVAKEIGQHLGAGRAPALECAEGHEAEGFWEALGGQAEYPRVKVPIGASAPPRLFEISNRTGALRVDELFDWSQGDLLTDEAYLLDTLGEVFVWLGAGANEVEVKGAAEIAQAYLHAASRKGTATVIVREGAEPAMFTAHFRGWDPAKKAAFEDPYAAKLKALQEGSERRSSLSQPAWAATASDKSAAAAAQLSAGGPPSSRAAPSGGGGLSSWLPNLRSSPTKPADASAAAAPPPPAGASSAGGGAYVPPTELSLPLDALKGTPDPRVDPAHKELYLSDADFKQHLGCTKEEWAQTKAWKQKEKKKQLGIF